MVNAEKKQDLRDTMGIDHLLSHLDHINNQDVRLDASEVTALFRQLNHELPYATPILLPTLAHSLLSDSPLQKTKLDLNHVLVELGMSLCDPTQRDALIILMQTYLHERKKTEVAYASELASMLVNADNLKIFPDSAHPSLRHLACLILEKIIQEKQSRKIPGYRSFSLIEIIHPVIYSNLGNKELEHIKATQAADFRKWINTIAHNGYEQVKDEKKLTQVMQEKLSAFEVFKSAITEKIPSEPNLLKYQNRLAFMQHDKNQKHEKLMRQIDAFLKSFPPKSIGNELLLQLRLRFSEQLRKKVFIAEKNIAIYEREELIKQAHERAFNEVERDANTIRIILAETSEIHTNYSKNILHNLLGQKFLRIMDSDLQDILLGKSTSQQSPGSGNTYASRNGGYPHKNIIDILKSVIVQLQNLRTKITGLFAQNLKSELSAAIDLLVKTSQSLPAIPEPVINLTPEVTAATEPTPIKTPSISAAPPPLAIEEPEIKAETQRKRPIPQVKHEIIIERGPTKPAPVVTEPEIKLEKVEAKPLQIEEEPEITLEKIETKPLQIEEEPEITLEKIEAKPLQIEEEEPEITLEKIEAKPLLIEDEPEIHLEEPHRRPEASTENTSASQQDTINRGLGIMQQYLLGDFTQAVTDAWKKMVVTAEHSSTENNSDALFASDIDVHLYVICDLAQQIAGIDATGLSGEKQALLQAIKMQILKALENPTDEKNWDCFEGMKRDQIDQTIAGLL